MADERREGGSVPPIEDSGLRRALGSLPPEISSGTSPEAGDTGLSIRGLLLDGLVLLVSEGIAVPLNIGAGEAFVHRDFLSAVIGWAPGLPLMFAGFAFPILRRRLPQQTRIAIRRQAISWAPAVVLLAFAYVVGPALYNRITSHQTPNTETPADPTSAPPKDVLALVGSLRAQLDSANDTVESQKRELGIVKRDLELARHPPPRAGPLSAASLSLAMDKGTPRELAADNVRWMTRDANARGSEVQWSAPLFSSYTVLTPQPSYPDLSGFSDGEYQFTKEGGKYRLFRASNMTLIFLSFDKPVDTGSVQLTSDSTLPKWHNSCKDIDMRYLVRRTAR
jgi:hypothetical protein